MFEIKKSSLSKISCRWQNDFSTKSLKESLTASFIGIGII
jgi:hypothetical protein